MAKEQTVCLVGTQRDLLLYIEGMLGFQKITVEVCEVDPDQPFTEETFKCIRNSSKAFFLLTETDKDKWKHRITSVCWRTGMIQLRLVFAGRGVAKHFREAPFSSIPGHIVNIYRSHWERRLISFARVRVLVVHSDTDAKDAVDICTYLDTQGLETHAEYKGQSAAGGVRIDMLEKEIRKSDRIVLLLTKSSVRCHFVSLQTILALEKTLVKTHMPLAVILWDVNEKDCTVLRSGLLSCIPHNDFCILNKDLGRLSQLIKADQPMVDLLPVGDLAHGLVFSHYFGYQGYLAKYLDRILEEDSDKTYQKNKEIFPLKCYQLLPESCKIRDSLETTRAEEARTGIRITLAADKQCITYAQVEKEIQVGKPRKFVNPIYKIENLRANKREQYYFCGGFPPSLYAIRVLSELEIVKVDVKLHYERFRHTYNAVVYHKNSICENRIELVPFNDKHTATYTEKLLEVIKKDVRQGRRTQTTKNPGQESSGDVVCVCFYDEVEQGSEESADRQEADRIRQFLSGNNKMVKFLSDEQIGKTPLHIPEAKWYVFVISKRMIESDDVNLFNCQSLLTKCVDGNDIRVLPVLIDVEITDIPICINWVAYFTTKTRDYMKYLLQTINGKPMTMESRLPAGDVVTGLAWAFVVNYLRIVLRETETDLALKDRIQKYVDVNDEARKGCKCPIKLFVFWPKSCTWDDDLHDKITKGSASCRVKHLGEIKAVMASTGGQPDRPFTLHMFKYTDTSKTPPKEVCFLAEYCMVIKCLYNMVHDCTFSGFTLNQLYTQGKEFIDTIEDIINRDVVKRQLGDFTDSVKFIYYDDKDDTRSLLSIFQTKSGIDMDNIDSLSSDKCVEKH